MFDITHLARLSRNSIYLNMRLEKLFGGPFMQKSNRYTTSKKTLNFEDRSRSVGINSISDQP